MTVAERWLYCSQIGLLGMIGVGMSSWLAQDRVSDSGVPRRNVGIPRMTLLGIIIISLFFFRSFLRTLDWRDGLTLYGSSIARDSSFDLQNNMGVELFRIGKYAEAKEYFEKSTLLAPYWWVNWNNLGASYEHEQNYEKAREYYEKSIHNGDYQLAYENLGKILVAHGTDKKKANEFVTRSLELFPGSQTLQELQKYVSQ